MELNGPLLDLSHAGSDIITKILASMPLRDRFICALVCKAWAKAAIAATHSLILRHNRDTSSLQHWLEKHGDRLEVLQLHVWWGPPQAALACCAKLKDLLLHGPTYFIRPPGIARIASRTWGYIATATGLTSLSLSHVQTESQQADVVALSSLEQLTWRNVYFSEQQPLSHSAPGSFMAGFSGNSAQCSKQPLSDSLLLQQLTQLTSLELRGVTAAALQHLGSLTKLQHLSISDAEGWAAAGCPGLQDLKALTSLKLARGDPNHLPPSISQLTALRQLDVQNATPAALNGLQVLTGLTHLSMSWLDCYAPESVPLQLPGLQHLELRIVGSPSMSLVASCTQLQFLKLKDFNFKGPGSLVGSTVLQHLELNHCAIAADDGAADPVSWQQVLVGPGQLPHLTSLQLFAEKPTLQQADVEAVVACCSNLKVLGCDTLQDSVAPAMARLPSLTNLHLGEANDALCRAMVQLTGLRQLAVWMPDLLSAVGLRQLAALNQLTSLGFGKFYRSKLDTLAGELMTDNLPDYPYAIINKAPRGSPPDVSSRLLDMCDVVDACKGLKIKAVIKAAVPSKSPGPLDEIFARDLTAEELLAGAAAVKALDHSVKRSPTMEWPLCHCCCHDTVLPRSLGGKRLKVTFKVKVKVKGLPSPTAGALPAAVASSGNLRRLMVTMGRAAAEAGGLLAKAAAAAAPSSHQLGAV